MVASYGYQEIRFPVLEKTDLFHTAIGEVTDVVEKEKAKLSDAQGVFDKLNEQLEKIKAI